MVRGLGFAMLALVAACLAPASGRCQDGRACTPGLVCVEALDQCVAPDQLTACGGAADGVRCTATGIDSGTCKSGACLVFGCGNGFVEVEAGEVCDDGNTDGGDHCSADCTSDLSCGNQIIDPGERCDCGTPDHPNPGCPGPNSDTSGTCSLTCQLRCGDGVISADERCDPRASPITSCAGSVFDRGLTSCSTSCQPDLSGTGCRYIGWRTVAMNNASLPVLDLEATTAERGYFIQGNNVDSYLGTTPLMQPTAFSHPLRSLWVGDDGSGFLVGDAGVIGKLGVTGWTAVTPAVTPSLANIDLVDVWGRSGADVYVLGDAVVLHWNGSSWSYIAAPPEAGFRRIAGDATHLYIAGAHGLHAFDGTTWQTVWTQPLRSVWAAAGLAVAVGDAGLIVQNDGSGWIPGRTTTTADLLSVRGDQTHGFFIGGTHGTLLGYDGHVWRQHALGRGVTGPADQTIIEVGVGPGGVGALGLFDLMLFDGSAWIPSSIPTTEVLRAIWGSASDDVFAVGNHGTILHHDGLRWTAHDSGVLDDLQAVWGTGPDDVWAAGDQATLLHYDGLVWTTQSRNLVRYSGLAVFGDDVFVAATVGGVIRFTQGSQTHLASSPQATVIWGTGPTDLYVAGAAGIAHYDGTTFAAATSGPVTALSGTSATDIYALGTMDVHFDGTTWSAGPFSDPDLVAVHAVAPNHVFAVGHDGRLRHWNGIAVEPLLARTTVDLNGVFAVDNVVFMVGVDGTIETLVFHD